MAFVSYDYSIGKRFLRIRLYTGATEPTADAAVDAAREAVAQFMRTDAGDYFEGSVFTWNDALQHLSRADWGMFGIDSIGLVPGPVEIDGRIDPRENLNPYP